MNNNYYPNYQMPPGYPNQPIAPNINNSITNNEVSDLQSMLKLNKGKLGKFYCTFPDSEKWKDTVFTGIIELAGKDYFVINNPNTEKWYTVLFRYLNYIEFDEKIRTS